MNTTKSTIDGFINSKEAIIHNEENSIPVDQKDLENLAVTIYNTNGVENKTSLNNSTISQLKSETQKLFVYLINLL